MSGSYEAIAWLKPESDFDLEHATPRLKKWLPGAELSRHSRGLMVSLGGWEIWLYLVEKPHVGEEAEEFPTLHPNCPRNQEIAQCRRRVELYCPEEDPGMGHFNDFVFVLQALEEFQGIILFDPMSEELI